MSASDSSTSKELTFKISECKVVGVTVFRDRAEVVRSIILPTTTEAGNYKLTIPDLTISSDPESIRFKGNSNCQIVEVGHEEQQQAVVSSVDSTELSSKIDSLKSKLKDLNKKHRTLGTELQQQEQRKKLTQSYANGVMSEAKVTELDKAKEILSFYSSEMAAIDSKLSDLEELRSAVNTEIESVKKELRSLGTVDSSTETVPRRSLTVLMDLCSAPPAAATAVAAAEEEVEQIVQFSYVVFGARWSPSYDLRVNLADNSMQLAYFAEVTQQSGEDWEDCALFLSTSNPAVGSAPDRLPIKIVDWEYRLRPVLNRFGGGGGMPKPRRNMKKQKNSLASLRSNANVCEEEDNDDDRAESVDMMGDGVNSSMALCMAPPPPGAPAPPPPTTAVQGNGDAGSTTFTILRQVSIAADNKPHKVVVANLQLNPQMIYYVAPSVSTSVYLQSKTMNTSSYPLLASDKVSVFLDGNFISTSSMKQASSGEFFNTFLGVDPSFKVEYPPCRMNSKVKGWLSGVTEKKYQYSTYLLNTKQYPCKVMVVECLPRSQDEKIKVELLEPKESALSKTKGNSSATNEQDFIATLENINEAAAAADESQHSGAAGGAGAVKRGSTTAAGATAAQKDSWPSDFIMQNVHTSSIIWLRTVQPGEKAELKFSYQITSPETQPVGIKET